MNNIEILNSLIKEVKEFYSDENNDDFFLLEIDNKEWLILKSQGVMFLDIILNDYEILYNKEIDFIKMKKICTCLKRSAQFGYEMSVYKRMLDRIENIILNNIYNISNIEENIEKIRERYSMVINQCNTFDGFKHNQNRFDNMISIIKILQRLENSYIKINFNSMILDTEKDNSDYYKNLIKQEFFKEFSGLRFMI